jgi:hypothetical protein
MEVKVTKDKYILECHGSFACWYKLAICLHSLLRIIDICGEKWNSQNWLKTPFLASR